MQLNTFKIMVWDTIASYEDDPDVIMVAQFSQLSTDEKDSLETPKGKSRKLYCICQVSSRDTDPAMVA